MVSGGTLNQDYRHSTEDAASQPARLARTVAHPDRVPSEGSGLLVVGTNLATSRDPRIQSVPPKVGLARESKWFCAIGKSFVARDCGDYAGGLRKRFLALDCFGLPSFARYRWGR